MKFQTLALLILLIISTTINAQLKTYLGIETGPAWDINRAEDAGHIFSQASIPGSINGLTLSQELIPNLSIESGLSYHRYNSGINLDDERPGNAGWQKLNAFLIPVRVSYKLRINDYPFSFTPRIGYQYGMMIGDPLPYTANSVISDISGTTIQYTLTENNPIASAMHMIELGFSTEYIFDNNWELSLVLSNYSGLSEMATSDITVTPSSGPNYAASYSMDGTRFQVNARLSIPVSNLWENKDLRIRTAIEQSRGAGRSSIRPQNYVYFGGDVGALWRSFQTSNPAVGSRPITGKGLFRYSNLHTGVYFGYLFKNNFGLDIGAYYQRSSLFFSLMYDHEVDFVSKTRAPLYLEFPIKFRYFYEVYRGKVIIVPRLGISVLTHFSAGNYGAGSGIFENSTVSGIANETVDYSGLRSSRIGLMLKAGIGGEYQLPIKFPLFATVSLEYSHGLKEIDEIQVTTSINETPIISTVKYLGSGWNLSAGIRIPILLGKDNRKCGAEPIGR